MARAQHGTSAGVFFGGGKGKCERIPEFGVEITSMVVSGSRKRW